jgi:hypothetical protein
VTNQHKYAGSAFHLAPSVIAQKTTFSPSPPFSPVNPSSAAMANWPCDPFPHVPTGYTLEMSVNQPLLRQVVFITGCYTLYNEDLVIVHLQPPVHKDDFEELKSALHTFFHEVH